MSFVELVPETLTAAVTDLTGIGSMISAANATAAVPTSGLLAAGGDEVSAALATLFGEYGREYQALAGQLDASYDRFTRNLAASMNSYAATEFAGIGQLLSGLAAGPSHAINEPVRELTGRPLFGDGTNGYTTARGVGTPGGPGGWLFGDGGTGGVSTSYGVAGGAGGAGGFLLGNGGTGGGSLYGGMPGGPGGPAGLIGIGGTGGASGPGGVGGPGGRSGLLGLPGTAGISTQLAVDQTLIHPDQYGNPILNISVGDGPSVPVIVDSGATGLVVPPQYVNVATLGNPTGSGSVSYGGTLFVDYQTYQTTLNFGNGIVTTPTTVGVATSAYLGNPSNPVAVSSLPAYLGVGPNDGYPFTTPVTSALPGDMNEGVLINLPRGMLEFGPNPLPPLVALDGAPRTVVQVQINHELPQTVGAFIDSGGVSGAIPQSLAPGLDIGNHLPAGTTITVSTINGVPLYTQTVTVGDTPVVVASATGPKYGAGYYVFNTGNYPFSQLPIYIWNNDAVGTTIFDQQL